ncbi:MAG: substrate-binding domain-containing protein [Planctomycetes bacterium]|nr:substrate-binding domain-containing protein [Planctomycetota bacterium]
MPALRHRRTLPEATAALAALCRKFGTGKKLPTHLELMRRVGASERTVLEALAALQRAGRVERRNGVGTFVLDAPAGDAGGRPLLPAVDAGLIVAVARPDRSFFDHCLQALHREAGSAGLTLVSRLLAEGEDAGVVLPPRSQRPRGFLLFRRDLEPLAVRLQQAGQRVVLVGSVLAGTAARVPSVAGDHERGGLLATRHLLALGHRRVAFLGDADVERTRRWRGHQRALDELGQTVTAVRFGPAELAAWQADPRRAARVCRAADGPTAFAVWNDHQAALLLGVLARAGIAVPAEVSVIGYDNLPFAALLQPALTTIDQLLDEQVELALALLLGPPPPADTLPVIVAAPTLVARASCAPPPRAAR